VSKRVVSKKRRNAAARATPRGAETWPSSILLPQ
jgi:hypothetical protein